MKELILFTLVLFSIPQFFMESNGMRLNGQEICSDTIYPMKTKKMITNCCIEKVENENLVIYLKNGDRYAVEAKAIVKSGVYIPLKEPAKQARQPIRSQDIAKVVPNQGRYPGSYEYYKKKHKKARIIQSVGGFVTVAGLAMFIGGAVSYSNGNLPYETAVTIVTVGFFGFHLGAPFFIAGTIMKSNNKKAMISAKQRSLNLSMGITGNGVGLVLNF